MHYRYQGREDGGEERKIGTNGGKFDGGEGPEGAVVPWMDGWIQTSSNCTLLICKFDKILYAVTKNDVGGIV
jgi:hypothetical protein